MLLTMRHSHGDAPDGEALMFIVPERSLTAVVAALGVLAAIIWWCN